MIHALFIALKVFAIWVALAFLVLLIFNLWFVPKWNAESED